MLQGKSVRTPIGTVVGHAGESSSAFVAPRLMFRANTLSGDWNSVVSWRLQPEGDGTRLLIQLTGFDPADPTQRLAHEVVGKGSQSHMAALC